MDELRRKDWTIYECKIWGHGSKDLERAERCEQCGYSHGGPSPKMTQKANRKPSVQLDPIAT